MRHYAVRQVNPFEGVLQIVESTDARAYSTNGRVWQIQVLAERPDHTWRSFSDASKIEQFFNFGLWDAKDGMHKVPANPVLDIGAMSRAADALIDLLAPLLERLPFDLIDRHELWATDARERPVALLASTEQAERMADIRPRRWQATRIADHSFVSPSLLARGVSANGELGPRQHAEHLERRVHQLSQHETWFRRLNDGRGEPIAPYRSGQTVDAKAFPPLGLKDDWDDAQTRELALDYLTWQAPRLLLLQHLDQACRSALEQAACARAVALAEGYRLLPCIIDRAAVEAARVEARLRRAAVYNEGTET